MAVVISAIGKPSPGMQKKEKHVHIISSLNKMVVGHKEPKKSYFRHSKK